MLWGKARPEEGSAIPSHPLICHMIDVGVVAEQLIDHILPVGTTNRFLEGFGCERPVARSWALFIIALHDLGKATPAFQRKWPGAIPPLHTAGFDLEPRNQRDHGTVGPYFVTPILMKLGIPKKIAFQLARTVCAHHGSFPEDHLVPADGNRNPSRAITADERGRNPIWTTAREEIINVLKAVFPVPEIIPTFAVPKGRSPWAFFSYLAGLTSVADWIGSMSEFFIYEASPTDPAIYADRARQRAQAALKHVGLRPPEAVDKSSFEDLFGYTPRPLQHLAVQLCETSQAPLCAIVEAPMGEGKTEAAFYFAHALAAHGIHEGMYVALPTQATANQMFTRLLDFLSKTRDKSTAILVHGEASFDMRMRKLLSAVYGGAKESLICEGWFLGRKRSLLAPFGAGTIDQALLSVLRTKHAFVRQFGLASKTVILDEVHAYDTYTSKILERLVAWLGAMGASVIILSATLPSARRRALLEAYAGQSLTNLPVVAYPRVSSVDATHIGRVDALQTGRASQTVHLDWLDDENTEIPIQLISTLAERLEQGGCLGLIRNTVRRAQTTYVALRQAQEQGIIPEDTEFLLLHARFPMEERQSHEAHLVAKLGTKGTRPKRMIVVGTQVLEQSLDIDFDLMISDLAPVDLLLQRSGRIHRHLRPIRPAGVQAPRLIIVRPSGPWESCDLRSVGIVYAPFILRRTLMELESKVQISLPLDIEALVEAVYSETPPPNMPNQLQNDWEELEKQQVAHLQEASGRIWPNPYQEDDPFGSFDMPYRAEDPDTARALRAETRLGEESIAVICLFGSPEQTFLDAAHTKPISLHQALTVEHVRALAGRTVHVSQRGLVTALKKIKDNVLHPALAEVSVLSDRVPLFFEETSMIIDNFTLMLSPELGLCISRNTSGVGHAF